MNERVIYYPLQKVKDLLEFTEDDIEYLGAFDALPQPLTIEFQGSNVETERLFNAIHERVVRMFSEIKVNLPKKNRKISENVSVYFEIRENEPAICFAVDDEDYLKDLTVNELGEPDHCILITGKLEFENFKHVYTSNSFDTFSIVERQAISMVANYYVTILNFYLKTHLKYV